MKRFIIPIKRKPNNDSLALIAGNIASLNGDGIPFLNILELLKEMPMAFGYKESIYKIQVDIESGEAFEKSLKKHDDIFPEFFTSMISIGEKSGRLNESLKGVEDYYSKISSIRKTIINAVSYPVVLIGAMICLALFLALFIIPSFINVYSSTGATIPKSSLIIYNFVEKFKKEPLIMLVYITSWGIGIPWLLIKYLIKKHLRIPFERISIIREFYEHISISLLSIIVRSGINLSLGMDYCANSFQTGMLNKIFTKVNLDIINGKTLSEALEENVIYSKYTISILRLGEASGSMDVRLELLSKQLEKKSQEKINKLLAKLEPILILIMSGIVLLFILVFVAPLFGAMLKGAEG
ncbi:MAG: type II secretion system F family protein [Clostridium sp.]